MVMAGVTAAFSVSASGCPTLSYQWVFNETNFLAGATNAMLTLSNVTSAQAGLYAAVVSHANGAVTSQSAILRVLAAPDFVLISRAEAVVSVTFSTVSGLLYTVQYNDTLGPGGWVPLPEGFRRSGTGAPLIVPDPDTSGPQRFYRILVE